jgi:hypothetical protein
MVEIVILPRQSICCLRVRWDHATDPLRCEWKSDAAAGCVLSFVSSPAMSSKEGFISEMQLEDG